MPNISEIKDYILVALITASLFGLADMFFKFEKRKVLKKLKRLPKKTKITEHYIKKYSHFFDYKWWHWMSVISFVLSFLGVFID